LLKPPGTSGLYLVQEPKQLRMSINWSRCNEVEQIPGKVGGVPILKRSRVQAEIVTINHEAGLSAEEIADLFDLPIEQVRRVIEYFDTFCRS
jgi:uncharacterized protein (DUF433 family)